MKPTVASFKLGPQEWRREGGRWYVHMWGWWGGSYPGWKWVEVSDDKVPSSLIDLYAKSV